MRKIVSKEDLEKKRKRNQIIIGVILVGLMVVSSLGYAFQTQDDSSGNKKINYKGYDFVNSNGLWTVTMGSFQFFFLKNPNNIEEINSSVNRISSYSNKPSYLTSGNIEAEQEIYRNFDQVILRRQYACLNETSCQDKSLPVKSCSDNFIIFEENTVSEILQKDNCVYIRGPKDKLVDLADRFVLKSIGVD